MKNLKSTKPSVTDILAIIPVRYHSTRFPGKPLAMLAGKPLVQHVYERAREVFKEVYVATDHEYIAQCVREFGGEVILTSTHHKSGTERCAEAYDCITKATGKTYDWVINIQGDEPFISDAQLRPIIQRVHNTEADIITLAYPTKSETLIEEIDDPNRVKVIISHSGNALYFSRNTLPHLRGIEKTEWPSLHTYYMHIGIYAYRPDTLRRITQLPASTLEKAESLEQLRWLEANVPICVEITQSPTFGIDTPDHLKAATLLSNV